MKTHDDGVQQPESTPVLQYAGPGSRGSSRLGLPIILAVVQFFWMPFWELSRLGWDRPKEPFVDSLYFLLVAAPSLAAAVASFHIWRYHAFTTKRIGPMVVCLCAGLISAMITGLVIFEWIAEVVLDPHGRWYPL